MWRRLAMWRLLSPTLSPTHPADARASVLRCRVGLLGLAQLRDEARVCVARLLGQVHVALEGEHGGEELHLHHGVAPLGALDHLHPLPQLRGAHGHHTHEGVLVARRADHGDASLLARPPEVLVSRVGMLPADVDLLFLVATLVRLVRLPLHALCPVRLETGEPLRPADGFELLGL
eukprot:CAMPEP_0206007628 /NCGR_PEP_ID=MMETSP1464-20131121/5874_1 /ASSEMBLY_ACC=CAM_ASM_001124 /TAXON_ID=119497 /ORGANISM="Exanthemachrysis gayraliae, Strain RCC1523" /LENGTH=175 /DNA_ID=CAMNT_0053381131 /DNA_START=318 /DNA_END=845 /DNA_ORIENTATION=-